MKIYTKTGDDGTTGLFGGGRIPKDHPRVAAYGTIDELNAQIGVVRALGLEPDSDAMLARIQSELFGLGADLATPDGVKAAFRVRRTLSDDATWLEEAIDRMTESVPPLESFILPGGTPAAAATHVARAVCRRAEREVVALSRPETVGGGALVYLNRLSDFLFVLARALNHRAGVPEPPWTP